jgi:EAL domain-containing protein (putative c-di-GMP-specific phosphodiesterase class I)
MILIAPSMCCAGLKDKGIPMAINDFGTGVYQ